MQDDSNTKISENSVHLSIIKEKENLLFTYKKDEQTINLLDKSKPDINILQTKWIEMINSLNIAAKDGRQGRKLLHKLKEFGRWLGDELLPLSIKKELKISHASYLILDIDVRLIDIPWELICLSDLFLCQQFNTGRSLQRKGGSVKNFRNLSKPIDMWIIANPENNLENTVIEGTRICEYMYSINKTQNVVETCLDSGLVSTTVDNVKTKIKSFDFVHFACHAEYNLEAPEQSGLKMSDGLITAQDISKMANGSSMPAFIFSNACESARSSEWIGKQDKIENPFGLANAFLLAGVKHYLGTFWMINDTPGCNFAIEFYKYLRIGKSIGESTKLARESLINGFDLDFAGWASYILYGDPRTCYFDHNTESKTILKKSLTKTNSKDTIRGKIKEWFNGKHIPSPQNAFTTIFVTLLVVLGFIFIGHQKMIKNQRSEILHILQKQMEIDYQIIDNQLKTLQKEFTDLNSHSLSLFKKEDGYITIAVFYNKIENFMHYGSDKLLASIVEQELLKLSYVKLLERMRGEVIWSIEKRLDKQSITRLLKAEYFLYLETIIRQTNFFQSKIYMLIRLVDQDSGVLVESSTELLENELDQLLADRNKRSNLFKEFIGKLEKKKPSL